MWAYATDQIYFSRILSHLDISEGGTNRGKQPKTGKKKEGIMENISREISMALEGGPAGVYHSVFLPSST